MTTSGVRLRRGAVSSRGRPRAQPEHPQQQCGAASCERQGKLSLTEKSRSICPSPKNQVRHRLDLPGASKWYWTLDPLNSSAKFSTHVINTPGRL